jgi:hypothetical protein
VEQPGRAAAVVARIGTTSVSRCTLSFRHRRRLRRPVSAAAAAAGVAAELVGAPQMDRPEIPAGGGTPPNGVHRRSGRLGTRTRLEAVAAAAAPVLWFARGLPLPPAGHPVVATRLVAAEV